MRSQMSSARSDRPIAAGSLRMSFTAMSAGTALIGIVISSALNKMMIFTGMSSKMMRFGVMNAVFIIICYLAVIAVFVDVIDVTIRGVIGIAIDVVLPVVIDVMRVVVSTDWIGVIIVDGVVAIIVDAIVVLDIDEAMVSNIHM